MLSIRSLVTTEPPKNSWLLGEAREREALPTTCPMSVPSSAALRTSISSWLPITSTVTPPSPGTMHCPNVGVSTAMSNPDTSLPWSLADTNIQSDMRAYLAPPWQPTPVLRRQAGARDSAAAILPRAACRGCRMGCVENAAACCAVQVSQTRTSSAGARGRALAGEAATDPGGRRFTIAQVRISGRHCTESICRLTSHSERLDRGGPHAG
mmetsp:Transcript_56591/g.136850  ORF Transcript_56591/g.136850 Transcript_56591/m.136850 type:complete len:210 (-) Transcript_56591:198-827(-)